MGSGAVVPVVLCGGAGTRLWPASRESRPKQFIPLTGPRSPFQDTILGVADPALFGKPIVVANRDHRFLVAGQLSDIGIDADILLEPARRDSAPAIGAAACFAQARDPDAVLLILAADHLVRRPDVFRDACRAALASARAGHIVVFGVAPEGPATSYGYIKPGAAFDASGVHGVEAFVEKPDATTARDYVSRGYLWNAGNFLAPAKLLFDEYAAFEPDSAAAVAQSVAGIVEDFGFLRLAEEPFARTVAKSFDYAVMEHTARALVMPVDHGWHDLGTWDAIWDVGQKDERGNVARGTVEFMGSENSLAMSDRPLVAVAGLRDVVVIADDDAVLVARRGDADGIRSLVNHLRGRGHAQADDHARGYRPWGFFQSLDSGSRFRVKRIVVRPGARLSLQRHAHRAEHWVVVSGTAEITVGDETRRLGQDESTYIPPGVIHRLYNPAAEDLEIIEVQTGAYLGEDDIERFDDLYGR